MRSGFYWVWFIGSLVWLGAVTVMAVEGWPRLSLDLSAGDAGTLEALRWAQLRHVFVYGAIGLAPLVVGVAIGRLGGRPRA
ncbi:MAG: hypothetical protein NW205_13245 [Hyphomicrobiaceae bacterium]|nr:hypothetical protein [Hyphomicrobiaceae bacterium]